MARISRGECDGSRRFEFDLPWAVKRIATARGCWPPKHLRENSRAGTWLRRSAARYGRSWPTAHWPWLCSRCQSGRTTQRNAQGRPARTRRRANPRIASRKLIAHARRSVVAVGRRLLRGGIPWRGWKDILWRAYEKMNDNRLLAVAAGVVFYALLALFPAVTAFVSLYGLVADASTAASSGTKAEPGA